MSKADRARSLLSIGIVVLFVAMLAGNKKGSVTQKGGDGGAATEGRDGGQGRRAATEGRDGGPALQGLIEARRK